MTNGYLEFNYMISHTCIIPQYAVILPPSNNVGPSMLPPSPPHGITNQQRMQLIALITNVTLGVINLDG